MRSSGVALSDCTKMESSCHWFPVCWVYMCFARPDFSVRLLIPSSIVILFDPGPDRHRRLALSSLQRGESVFSDVSVGISRGKVAKKERQGRSGKEGTLSRERISAAWRPGPVPCAFSESAHPRRAHVRRATLGLLLWLQYLLLLMKFYKSGTSSKS